LVPGVGKKTAERLLIELRGKLQLPVLDVMAEGKSGGTSVMTDVREALTGLGYSSEEIRDVLRDLSAADSAESVLRQALNALGVRRA
jgi:Holliday junction DNA helicase RuvA